MDPQRLARLTEQQRTCLRFVYSHMTSKEIAPLLGIEPGSVDQHLKAAMRVLGVADRRTAARLLAESEQREDTQPLVYQPLDIVPQLDSASLGLPIEGGPQQFGRPGDRLREEQMGFQLVSPGGAPALPLPIGDAKPGDLNWLARLAWIAAIAIGIALAFGALVSGVEALGRLIKG
jgi:DNA-binding CsgD family transcriptional regulator